MSQNTLAGTSTLIIACATVIEEMLPHLPHGIDHQVLEFGLHLQPENLKATLQQAIDQAAPKYEVIILGYGLCSLAVVGLTATNCTLVVPRVDDCIAIFLGSQNAYRQQSATEPGTYYLTKGWIEVSDTLLDEHQRMVDKYNQSTADRLMRIILKNYRRLVYIDTGTGNQDYYRQYARQVADKFDLRFQEVRGSNRLLIKLLTKEWDKEFVVAQAGHTISYLDFKLDSSDPQLGKPELPDLYGGTGL